MDDDQQAEIRNKMLGFIFQQYNLIPKLNVLENVELPLLYAGVDASERKERAMASLQRVGLADKCRNLPSQLSGGQQQRVSIARALAGSPSVILADEPTGALDSRTGREVLGFLKKLNREGDTVVLITHDNSIAVKADRIVRLQDGKIIYDGDAHDPRAVVRPEEMELSLIHIWMCIRDRKKASPARRTSSLKGRAGDRSRRCWIRRSRGSGSASSHPRRTRPSAARETADFFSS